jgi:hypothetical protein
VVVLGKSGSVALALEAIKIDTMPIAQPRFCDRPLPKSHRAVISSHLFENTSQELPK